MDVRSVWPPAVISNSARRFCDERAFVGALRDRPLFAVADRLDARLGDAVLRRDTPSTAAARRWPSARLYSSEPRSSVWPAIANHHARIRLQDRDLRVENRLDPRRGGRTDRTRSAPWRSASRAARRRCAGGVARGVPSAARRCPRRRRRGGFLGGATCGSSACARRETVGVRSVRRCRRTGVGARSGFLWHASSVTRTAWPSSALRSVEYCIMSGLRERETGVGRRMVGCKPVCHSYRTVSLSRSRGDQAASREPADFRQLPDAIRLRVQHPQLPHAGARRREDEVASRRAPTTAARSRLRSSAASACRRVARIVRIWNRSVERSW